MLICTVVKLFLKPNNTLKIALSIALTSWGNTSDFYSYSDTADEVF